MLYSLEPIGPAFRSATLFQEIVPTSQLNTFLSLASSFLDTSIDRPDFSVEIGGLILEQPAILFREVDKRSALYLNFAPCYPP